MNGTTHGANMNLSTISCVPHALGYIKVACEDDPLFGAARTRNEFLITTRHHQASDSDPFEDGAGVTRALPKLAAHPAQAALAKSDGEGSSGVVKEIPIKLFFNKVENALSIKYQAYDTTRHAPVCSGDGKNARRHTLAADNTPTVQEIGCPGPERCDLVLSGAAACRRQVRMPVQIEGQGDPLSVFEVRTGSINTYRALRGQLQMIAHRFGGLRHVPLRLVLWEASNEASSFQPFSLMRLELAAESELEAMKAAKAARDALTEAGINDDVDAAMGGVHAEDDELTASPLEFQAVREFFQPPARREGTAPVVGAPNASARRRGADPALATAATTYLDKAVASAGALVAPPALEIPTFP